MQYNQTYSYIESSPFQLIHKILTASKDLTWLTRMMAGLDTEEVSQLWIAYQYQLSFFESQ